MKQLTQDRNKQNTENDLRLLPLGIAAIVCFIIAVSSGSTVWYFTSSKSPFRKSVVASNNQLPTEPFSSPEVVVNNQPANNLAVPAASVQTVPENQNTTPAVIGTEPSPAASPESPVVVLAPAGELIVEGGEIVLGGGETKLPLRREAVASFSIAETEVTNAQFEEFIKATNSKIKLPTGKDNEPVSGISWSDAKSYCDWLTNKIGVEVRLPTEAEWELAARGKDNLKYPWGSEWRDDAAACKENKGKVSQVKSYPNGKSNVGAYDMVGNVWEWTSEVGRDALGKTDKSNYVIKGGAAVETRINNYAQARIVVPKDFSSPDIGFRYVVIRKK